MARDLSAGNLVAAYRLPNPSDADNTLVAIASPSVPGGIQVVSAKRARAAARRTADAGANGAAQAPEPLGPPPPGPGGRGSHDLVPPAGGGAAMPLLLVTVLMLMAVPCIKLAFATSIHPLGAVGYRLERPG